MTRLCQAKYCSVFYEWCWKHRVETRLPCNNNKHKKYGKHYKYKCITKHLSYWLFSKTQEFMICHQTMIHRNIYINWWVFCRDLYWWTQLLLYQIGLVIVCTVQVNNTLIWVTVLENYVYFTVATSAFIQFYFILFVWFCKPNQPFIFAKNNTFVDWYFHRKKQQQKALTMANFPRKTKTKEKCC